MIEKKYPFDSIANLKIGHRSNGASFRIVLITKEEPSSKFGSARGLIEMSDDFDEPLDDFKEYGP